MTFSPLNSVDDFYYFYLVVKYAGFGAASEATNISKSKLSRHVSELESKFNVQLIQRTTRQFKVTDLGLKLYHECCKMMTTVDGAENILMQKILEPEGVIRIVCPPLIAHSPVRKLLNEFLRKNPKVKISISLTNQLVDLDSDKVDIILRNNFDHFSRHDFHIHDLISTAHVLVAHPDLPHIDTIKHPEDLNKFPCIHFGMLKAYYIWHLKHKVSGKLNSINVEPRLISNDLSTIYYATHDALGISEIPLTLIKEEIEQGRLIQILPEWQTNESQLKIAYSYHNNDRFLVEKLVEHLFQGFKLKFEEQTAYNI